VVHIGSYRKIPTKGDDMNRNTLKGIFETELLRRGIPYFISGSVRFGYCIEISDLDIVVDGSDFEKVSSLTKDMDGISYSTFGYDHALVEFKFFGEKVHVSVQLDQKEFLDLKKEHENVECFLGNNQYLIYFIRHLKKSLEISGTVIYNIVKAVMEEKIPVVAVTEVVKKECELRDRFLRPQI
jgi:hypothetical protein